jgi:hypothetical protein
LRSSGDDTELAGAIYDIVATDKLPKAGQGRLKVEELKAERGRFYVTVTYGEAGQTRIDYKTYDLKKASEYPFTTNRGDAIKEITIVRVPAD